MASRGFVWPFQRHLEPVRTYAGPGAPNARPRKGTVAKPTALFSPFQSRSLTLKNRIVVSPMCMYSSEDGFLNDHHLVHLGNLARGGAAVVTVEATGVTPEGRITYWDSGLWKDEQIAPLRRIVDFVHANGALASIQLAHAGRKASTYPPFFPNAKAHMDKEQGGWTPVAPSAVPWAPNWAVPHALTVTEIQSLIDAFAAAARRADKAGFDIVEIHGAHGYLISSFNSPLANKRTDQYGGSFENRTRFCVEVTKAVRAAWPANKPLWLRLSCSDWVDGGWDIEQSVRLAKVLKGLGVDLIDCSSGGQSPQQAIRESPGYQVPFAEAVRREAGVPVGAVGKITDAAQAEEIVASGKADVVSIARELLRQPYWPLHAAKALGADVEWPLQYERAKY